MSGRKTGSSTSEPVGSGGTAFRYLAPYIFRVAISNKRLEKLRDGRVTFSYKESTTDQIKRSTVTAAEFIRRFLQHVLPKRFIKVRYYGLLSPANRHLLMKARQLLEGAAARVKNEDAKTGKPVAELCCPSCGGRLTLIGPITPRGHSP